jgi:hypothetical protein
MFESRIIYLAFSKFGLDFKVKYGRVVNYRKVNSIRIQKWVQGSY